MKAAVCREYGQPLVIEDVTLDPPQTGEVQLRVAATAICHSDVHRMRGDWGGEGPIILGHEIVGVVESAGTSVSRFRPGELVGVPWLAWSCRDCRYCRSHRENLCHAARFTGYHVAGGYAEYTVAHADYCFAIPANMDPVS